MQVSTPQREIAAAPGAESRVLVKVVNTTTIIDGLTARLIGVGQSEVRSEPAMLPLFPDGEGEFALAFAVPGDQPAGRHPLTVEVRSHTTGAVHHADVDLDVSARPGMRVVREPRMVRARRTGRFVLAVVNEGNVPLDVSLAGVATDAGTTVTLSSTLVRVEPGTTRSVMAKVRGPRMFTGSEVDRTVGVDLVARETHGTASDGAVPGVEAEPVLAESTSLQLRQRPLVSRGLLTFLVLAAIVALWAAVFLFGLVNVFAGDALTKTAPPSYFSLASASADDPDDAGGNGTDGGADGGAGPPSALPKTGLLPPGVGGQIAGTVHAASDDSPVGRILVVAYREGRGGRLVPVSSGATQSDGTYTLAGLFPTDYRLKFSAKGYDEVWYPDARRAGGAEPVTAEAQTSVGPVDVTIDGRQGSISGVVEQGDTQPVPTQVSARLLDGSEGTAPAARTVTDADGGYELTGLRAPGTYEISFVAEGYRATTVVQRLAGGEDRIQPTVLLSAGGGEVNGVVRGEDGPLGGVTVTTDVGGQPVSVVTPTAGTVGAFSLQDLPTPGTYVVTFAAEGYGEHVEIIDLGPGESRTGFDQRLEAGSGSVTGTVRGPGGKPLGNVEVVVGGAATPEGHAPTATTLTTGSVGSYALNDLPVPGDYTLTFTAPGFAPETRPFSLTAEDPSATVEPVLTTRLGSLTGKVTRPAGGLLVGATVVASNGIETFRTTSSGRGGALPAGGYLIPGLTPGWYSVTATLPGHRQRTALVRVDPGDATSRDLALPRGG